MKKLPSDVVPMIGLEERYNGRMMIWTPRTVRTLNVNSWFGYMESHLAELPSDGALYMCFDFATHAKSGRGIGPTPYFRQRLQKLAEDSAGNMRGRIAIASAFSIGSLLRSINWDDIASHFPKAELKAFGDRDAAIGWLVTGYERALLRA